MRENVIELYLCERAEEMGGRALKFVSPGTAGVLDRIVTLPGNAIGWAETKAPGKPLAPLQVVELAKLKALGCFAAKLDSHRDVDAFLAALAKRRQHS